MPTEKEPKSEGDDSALRRVINNTLYNPLFVDESFAEDEDDDDEDEEYEPSELAKLAMMDEDEYVEHMAEYMKRHRESNNK
jgi:hypothetical protein